MINARRSAAGASFQDLLEGFPGRRGELEAVKRAAVSSLIIFLIRIYQKTLSPLLPQACRFEPSCSNYMLQAVRKHGARRGVAPGAEAPASLPSLEPRRIRPRTVVARTQSMSEHERSSMDVEKRMLLAIALSMAILMLAPYIYQRLFPAPPKPATPAPVQEQVRKPAEPRRSAGGRSGSSPAPSCRPGSRVYPGKSPEYFDRERQPPPEVEHRGWDPRKRLAQEHGQGRAIPRDHSEGYS